MITKIERIGRREYVDCRQNLMTQFSFNLWARWGTTRKRGLENKLNAIFNHRAALPSPDAPRTQHRFEKSHEAEWQIEKQIKLNAMSWRPQNAHLLQILEWEFSWNVSFRKWCEIGPNRWIDDAEWAKSSVVFAVCRHSRCTFVMNQWSVDWLYH